MLDFISRQFRQPSGIAGRIVGAIMSAANLRCYRWIMRSFPLTEDDVVLEIGFGPGSGMAWLLKSSGCRTMHGLDFSALMVRQAAERNREAIAAGRLTLFQGDFADFSADTKYTKIIAINVIYFWKDIEFCARKLRSLLQPGGMVLLFSNDSELMKKFPVTKGEVFHKRDRATLLATFSAAGFTTTECRDCSDRRQRGFFLIARA